MYQLTSEDFVIRLSDGLKIYPRQQTEEGLAYIAWIRQGNEPIARDASTDFTYARSRASEYPPITDYLDGIVKGDQAQIDAYIAACQAVKAKYPKA
jgi:hypothetical protein